MLNGVKSDLLPISTKRIPQGCQGSVLGPTLVTLFTNDLSPSVRSGSLYMFADDATVFCIGGQGGRGHRKVEKGIAGDL